MFSLPRILELHLLIVKLQLAASTLPTYNVCFLKKRKTLPLMPDGLCTFALLPD